VLVGTVGCMSPERMVRTRQDVSWDLRAVAVVACEAVVGALLFPVSSRTARRQTVLDARSTLLRESVQPDNLTRRSGSNCDRCARNGPCARRVVTGRP